MSFYNDEYTLKDELNRKDEISTIRDMILKVDTPFSIGVSGKWGSGKTSIMKYLMASLGGEPLGYKIKSHTITNEKNDELSNIAKKYKDEDSYHAIWFNPWENENHKEPMVGLLQEIHNHFSFYFEAKKEIEKLVSVSIQSGLDMLGSFLKLGKNQGSNIIQIGEKHEYDNFQYIDRNQKFKFMFQDAISTLLDASKKFEAKPKSEEKVIIFIDDLDRCEDETIVKLLKEIKQYLSTKKCVFVFGFDRYQIEKSLSKVQTSTHKQTREYLEKLFQATFYIKDPSKKDLPIFIKAKLKQLGINKKLDADNNKKIEEFISSIIDSNPRRIKGYLISLYSHIENSSFSKKKKITLDDFKKLSLITYLKFFYESVYTALENKNNMIKSIVQICKDKDKSTIDSAEKYFIHLEFLSHIHNTSTRDFTDEKLQIETTKNDINTENKFLNEIYQMQGKHTSFDNFREEFAKMFSEEEKIEKYL